MLVLIVAANSLSMISLYFALNAFGAVCAFGGGGGPPHTPPPLFLGTFALCVIYLPWIIAPLRRKLISLYIVLPRSDLKEEGHGLLESVWTLKKN